MDVETQPAFSPLYAVMNSVRSAQMLYMQLLTNPILTVPKQRSTQHHYPSGMVRTCALGESGVIVTHHCHLRARTYSCCHSRLHADDVLHKVAVAFVACSRKPCPLQRGNPLLLAPVDASQGLALVAIRLCVSPVETYTPVGHHLLSLPVSAIWRQCPIWCASRRTHYAPLWVFGVDVKSQVEDEVRLLARNQSSSP